MSAFNDDAFNDWGRCDGTYADPLDCGGLHRQFPPAAPEASREDLEAAQQRFPGISESPLWFCADGKAAFCRWWAAVQQLPDYAAAPLAVQQVVEEVIAGAATEPVDVMHAIKAALDTPVAALHIPVVSRKVSDVRAKAVKPNSTPKREAAVPWAYLVAVAKTLALRDALAGTAAYDHVHWAERQLPREARVYVVPHDKAAADPPAELQALVRAHVSSPPDFEPMLWALCGALRQVAGMPQRAPAKDQDRVDTYAKMLGYGVLCDGDSAALQEYIDAAAAEAAAALSVKRREWFERVSGTALDSQ
jgi:hypothetical protein